MENGAERVDALVVGAGIAGLYELHLLRGLGLRTIGGVGPYRQKCDEVAAAGYAGFELARAAAPA